MTCPDENSLARLLDARLPDVDRRAIERHLDTCSTCSALVAELAWLVAPRPLEAGGVRSDSQIAYVCGECGEVYAAAGTCARDGSDVQATSDALIGSDVGRYRFVRILGEGGMGRVYAAVQREIGSRVAIKVINLSYANDPELATRFLTEARAVNMIQHESIVKVVDLLRLADGRPVIVMELIEGQTLRQVVRDGTAPIGGVVQVMIEVLSALAAAHAIGIVHRDLKPDNILISTTGPKVLDFGIAKVVRLPAGQTVPRTRTGVLLGTPEYMAPEQIIGGAADARSDVYAAGVVLFEALTGQRPFTGTSDFEVMRAHIETPPPSICALRPAVPVELEHVIACALAKAPAERFANAGALAHALYNACASLPRDEWRSLTPSKRVISIPPPPPTLPSPAASLIAKVDTPVTIAPVTQRRSRAIIALAAGLVAATAIGVIVVAGSHEKPVESRVAGGSNAPVIATPIDAGIAPDERGLFVEPIAIAKLEPVGYLPVALGLARRLEPDAQVLHIAFDPIGSDGNFVHRATDPLSGPGSLIYQFTSSRRAKALAIGHAWCMITVTVDALGTAATVERVQLDKCAEATPRSPHCTAPQVWAKAIAKGFTPAAPADLVWDNTVGNDIWYFVGRRHAQVVSEAIADDCGQPIQAPRQPVARAAVRGGGDFFDDDRPAATPLPSAPSKPPLPAGTFTAKLATAAFDPIAYIATARTLARQLEPDAELVKMAFSVPRDGHVVFGRDGFVGARTYRFRSAKRGAPSQPPHNYQCMVEVELNGFGDVTTRREYDEWCTEAFVAAPRCTLEQIWAKAVSKRADPAPQGENGESRLTWDADAWKFDGVVDGNTHVFSFRDDCH